MKRAEELLNTAGRKATLAETGDVRSNMFNLTYVINFIDAI